MEAAVTRGRAALALLVVGALAAPAAAAQDDPLAAARRVPAVQDAVRRVAAGREATAALLARLAAIESPSGREHARAAAVAAEMRALGLADVTVSEAPNVTGVLRGRSGKAVVFVSTLDDLATVAEHQRRAPHPPRVEGDRVVGPGTNTSATTAALLAAARALVAAGVRPEHDLVFAAVAQEETGLVGMQALFRAWRARAVGFVDVLGDGRSVTYGALGIHWWWIVAHGPAGHSLNGGLPNVNQGIARAVDRIFSRTAPLTDAASRTVVNIAQLRSGAVFNHKPDTGRFSLDVRSLDAARIAAIEDTVWAVLDAVVRETGITFTREAFQRTPGGQVPGARESLLVRAAVAAAATQGIEARLGDAGSANLNVPLGQGHLAIGLGGERGGGRGTPAEFADIPAMMRTAAVLVWVAAAVGGVR
jgi:acetylornithine deacetylase/succinyl-diaminopimelate desuccinylase-like protein